MKKTRAAAALILTTAFALTSLASPALATEPVEADEVATEDVRVTLPLAHATDIQSAVRFAEGLPDPVVAYGFDNASVVGEFSPEGGMSVEEYLNLFSTEYGTTPSIVNIVVRKKVNDHEADQSRRAAPLVLGADLPVTKAAPVMFGGEIGQRKQDAENRRAEGAFSARTAGDWRPDATVHSALNRDNKAHLGQVFTWTGGGLYSLPSNVGLEFEINQDNPNVVAPQNIRHYCLDPNNTSKFWARNQSYNWSVTDYYGSNASAMAPYADYNDLSDLCRTQSIAIGLRYPKAAYGVDFGSGKETNIDISIFAPRGTSSTKIAGNVQAVSDKHCNTFPNMTLTDCMGVANITSHWGGYPSGTYNRATLGLSRNLYAPNLCWRTWNKGGDFQQISC